MLNSSGTKTRTYSYNAYGEVEKETGTLDNPWQYCGEYTDAESGLIYLRNRYYDPETGRFITEAPVKDGSHWYAYCAGNPIMFRDSGGLSGILPDGSYYITHKLDKRLLQIKQEYVNADAETRKKLEKEANTIRANNEKDKDWSVKADEPLKHYMIYPIDDKLNELLKETYDKYSIFNTPKDENIFDIKENINSETMRFVTFYNLLRNGAKYDLKNQPDWHYEHFIYNGEIIDSDAPGNIVYGYLGKIIGFKDETLLKAAGFAQIIAGFSSIKFIFSNFDDPRDQKRIKQGIDLYEKYGGNIK